MKIKSDRFFISAFLKLELDKNTSRSNIAQGG